MEEGRKAVRIEQWRWGWLYVPEAKTYVFTIIGVYSFRYKGKVYELKRPVDLVEWEKYCTPWVATSTVTYVCKESYIESLVNKTLYCSM
jgi:hypothetical protein